MQKLPAMRGDDRMPTGFTIRGHRRFPLKFGLRREKALCETSLAVGGASKVITRRIR